MLELFEAILSFLCGFALIGLLKVLIIVIMIIALIALIISAIFHKK